MRTLFRDARTRSSAEAAPVQAKLHSHGDIWRREKKTKGESSYRTLIEPCGLSLDRRTSVSLLECMAGATGLEPSTSAVTNPRSSITPRNQKARMANFGALGALSNLIGRQM